MLGQRPRTAPLTERSFLLTLGATFLFFLAMSAFVLMPRQLWELGASDSVIGWVMGAIQVTTAVVMPLVGMLLHRVSPRRFMVGGALLMALGCAALAQIEEISWLIYLVRAVQGLGFAAFFVSAGTLVVTVVPDNQRAQGLSLWGAGVLITQAVAPLGAEQLLRVGSFGHVYWAAAGACLAAALTSLWLPQRRPERAAPKPLLTLLRKPAVAVGLLALLSGSLGFGTIYSFLSAFTQREALGPVAPFFGAYTVGSLLVRLVGGKWADRYDRRLVIVPSLVLSALAIAALWFVRTGWHLVLVGALYGAGSGFSYPALMAFVVDQAEPADRARAVALDNWSFTVGMLLAATVFGPVADSLGMRGAFAGVGVLGAVAALALLTLRLPNTVGSASIRPRSTS
ncbi:MAG: hypothetical protein DRI90_14105 [Deltaproteobacteria bacterium]|nr:MAG: hypothetical protein DRI90_14105 [Deltaproteobacteria bacterium]